MKPYDRLLYWIEERHRVHNNRFPKGYKLPDPDLTGDPKRVSYDHVPGETPPPWTEDPILQTVFFCNPYRENDKVTAYLRDNFREENKDETCVFLGTILLRWFNYIPTMQNLIAEGIPQGFGSSKKKDHSLLDDAQDLLASIRDQGGQLFSAAYIIKLFNGMGKMEAIIQVMKELSTWWHDNPPVDLTMREMHIYMRAIRGMGNFYIYQFIGDLAYTHVFPTKTTPDWWTWSFSGPGTSRSINRLEGRDRQPNGKVWERRVAIPTNAEKFLEDLREKVNVDCKKRKLPPIHMRDLTGCLCEYDKYCRALNNERDLKRGYPGF